MQSAHAGFRSQLDKTNGEWEDKFVLKTKEFDEDKEGLKLEKETLQALHDKECADMKNKILQLEQECANTSTNKNDLDAKLVSIKTDKDAELAKQKCQFEETFAQMKVQGDAEIEKQKAESDKRMAEMIVEGHAKIAEQQLEREKALEELKEHLTAENTKLQVSHKLQFGL